MTTHTFETVDGEAILKHWSHAPAWSVFCVDCNMTHTITATRDQPRDKLERMFVRAADRVTDKYRTWEQIRHTFA